MCHFDLIADRRSDIYYIRNVYLVDDYFSFTEIKYIEKNKKKINVLINTIEDGDFAMLIPIDIKIKNLKRK